MIIRDYRETTLISDDPKRVSDNKRAVIDYMSKFEKFHLDENSRKLLTDYFRYLSRREKIKRKLSYNFMVHCDDDACAKKFVTTLSEIVNTICKTNNNITILSEMEFLNKAPNAFKEMQQQGVFAVYGCLSQKEFELQLGENKIAELKRVQNIRWKQYIQICEKTKETCKIIVASEDVLRERFRSNEHLYFRVFRNHIYIGGMSTDEIYEETLAGLKQNGTVCNAEFKNQLKKYIQVVYPKADLKNKAFIDDLIERILTKFYGEAQNVEEITAEFVPYYKVDKNYEDILKAMDELVGLEKVKETFLEIPYMLQESPKGMVPSLHMAFVGNSGTGKTTVAQLAADLLYSMGVIQRNKVVSISALDMIGKYVGETSRLTKDYCKQAYGGILFIDEAYLLAQSKNGSNNDQIKQECIGTLIQEMENNRDRLIVIFAGYSKEMDVFLHESNSGLGSRLYKIVEFEDYSDDELMEIFERMCKKDNYQITIKAKEKVRLKLTALRYSRDFGNARTVRNVYLEAKKEYRRMKDTDSKIFEERHIILDTNLRDYSTVKGELDEMIGLEKAKLEISRTIETCRFSKEAGIDVPISKHMLFLGNAGTGKSTVAKLFCQMLFSIGASKSPNCESIAAGDLLGRRNPVEALKEYCTKASGGVLFIDEAYALKSDARYCSSCISILLDVMEEERENITIILAGYEEEMKKFLNENQGLRSRFPVTVRFEDYSIDQLIEIFITLCSKYGFSISRNGLEKFKSVINDEKNMDNFGNARTVRNIFEQTFRLHAENYMKLPNKEKRFVFDENDIACLNVNNNKISTDFTK